MKHFRNILFPCILAALASCAARPDPAARVAGDRREIAVRSNSGKPLEVLFIGNSYSFGVPKALAKLSAQRGKNVRTDQATHSGWSLARHAANEETLLKLHERRWDVVVLQEQSCIPTRRLTRPFTMFPAIRKLAAEARNQGAVPVLYQTWGNRNGDATKPGDDFHAMTRRVGEGYASAAENAGGMIIVPAGRAWESEVSTGRGDGLFMPDGRHPTAYGNEVTAKVFFETLFPASPGR